MLISLIFFVGTIVLVQFWAIASIISWSVKKLIFLMKILKMADFVSVISPWKPSPRSKFGGPKRTSRTGQENGRKKKWGGKCLRGEFSRTKSCFFHFLKFSETGNFDRKIRCENSTYRKMEYNITTAMETFFTDIFWFKVCNIYFFWKLKKMQIFMNMAASLWALP